MHTETVDLTSPARAATNIAQRRYGFALGFLVGSLILGAGLAYGVPVGEGNEAPQVVSPSAPAAQARILFVGDIMLDRYIRHMLEERGPEHVFGGVRDLLASADVAVGNLEGPVTDAPSVSRHARVGEPGNMRFTFAPETPALLSSLGFGIVSLGNNHILDFGPSGAAETEQRLAAGGLAFVGYGSGLAGEPLVQDVNGIRIAFVSYNDFILPDSAGTERRIQRALAEGADAVVVLAHWDREYETAPSARTRTLAAGFVAAGAHLVIGTHAHVIGEREDRGGARIYYSLGNFAFDQYWEPQVRCGLAVMASFVREPSGLVIHLTEHEVGMRPDGRSVLGCA